MSSGMLPLLPIHKKGSTGDTNEERFHWWYKWLSTYI